MPKSKTSKTALSTTAKAILWGIVLYAMSFAASIAVSVYAFEIVFTGIMLMQLAALMTPILVIGAFVSFAIIKILEKNRKLASLNLKITPNLLNNIASDVDLENQLPHILIYQWNNNRALFLSNCKTLKKEKKLYLSNKDYSLVDYLITVSIEEEKQLAVSLIMDIIHSEINHDISVYGKDQKDEIISIMLWQYMRQAIELNHSDLISALPLKFPQFDYSGLVLALYKENPELSLEPLKTLLSLKDAQGNVVIDPDYATLKSKYSTYKAFKTDYFTFLKLALHATPANYEMAALLRVHGAKDFGTLSKEKTSAFKQWEKEKKPTPLAAQLGGKAPEAQENIEVILSKKPRRKRNKKCLS